MKLLKESKKYIRDGRTPIPEKELTSRIMSSANQRINYNKAINYDVRIQNLGG